MHTRFSPWRSGIDTRPWLNFWPPHPAPHSPISPTSGGTTDCSDAHTGATTACGTEHANSNNKTPTRRCIMKDDANTRLWQCVIVASYGGIPSIQCYNVNTHCMTTSAGQN